ncbi:MAG: endonuclease/exonuclease/phosphatase family protein [Anaerolineae bacterium]
MFARLRPYTVLLEAGLIGLFFIQALRYLIGALYSRVASASLVSAYAEGSYDPQIPGIVDPSVVSNEILFLGVMLALPLLSLLIGQIRFATVLASVLVIAGRTLMTFPLESITPLVASQLAVGGGLLYIGVLVARRNRSLPFFFVLGFAFEQIIRAFGNTLDPTIFDASRLWALVLGTNRVQVDLFVAFMVLAVLALILSVANSVVTTTSASEQLRDGQTVDPDRGLLTIWGAIGMGGLIFLELVLLALPNAIMGRTGSELYQLFVTLTLVATLLPIIPEVRAQARAFIAPFDPTTRGWIWLIFVALMIVLGTRIQQLPVAGNLLIPFGGFALILAQLVVSTMWWWLARPRTDQERNFGGLWLVLTTVIVTLLVAGDIFTYEYAFVRPFFIAGNPVLTDTLNQWVLPLLRGFRGLGLGLLLLAVLFGSLPMIQATRRIPWRGGKLSQSILSSLLVLVLGSLIAFVARPPIVVGVTNVNSIRIGTYNIHAGYSEFYGFTLDQIANDIASSGVAVVLLQDVEVGRLTSFGVDQSLWLARRLGMDERFYATNEGIQGLAVLSRVPIAFHDGASLPSIDRQTGLQRVQIQPDSNPNSVITLYNTELGFLLQGDNLDDLEQNQVTQLQTITAIIDAHRLNDYGGQLGRTILGGTFHNVASSPLMNIVRDYGFNDPFAGTNITLTATLNRSNLEPARIDFLWVWAQSLPQVGVNVVASRSSDHRMAYAEFQIQSDN